MTRQQGRHRTGGTIDRPIPRAPISHDRALLLDVLTWLRTNGWSYTTLYGWTNRSRALTLSTIRTPHPAVLVRRLANGYLVGTAAYRVDTVVQGVDVLVALGHLPTEFSSAYAAGQFVGGAR